MGLKERRERERDAVQAKILDAARELFARHGYEGVSVRGIAEKIEYSPTVIYQHFKDKETLIKELCYEDFGQLADALQATLKIADPVEGVRKCGEEYLRFAISHPNHYRLMFMTPAPAHIDEAERLERQGKPESDAYTLLRLLVQMAAAEGRLRDANANIDLVAQTLWAGVHGVIALHIILGCGDWTPWRPLEERAAAMLDTLSRAWFVEKL
ncbi:MAG: TetR/AcrR family transcriptional regulator [Terracidiphilus sp.]|jgi:AcrR family transcriptional regulator